jgi:cysteine desulfurase/selenocysteine lyase
LCQRARVASHTSVACAPNICNIYYIATVNRREYLRAIGGLGLAAATLRPSVAAQSADRALARTTDFAALGRPIDGKPLVYLDSAATTLRPAAVIDTISDFYRYNNANPSPTMHALARRAADRYTEARTTVARFINAAPDEIVWVRGTTEAINLAAASCGVNLREGDEILVSADEHYSNLLPWRTVAQRTGTIVKTFDVDDDGRFKLDDLKKRLSPGTRMVAVTHVSNVVGLVNPVAEVAAIAHKAGALVLVDGAQSVPHTAVDVRALDCDFFAFSSHKMLGPMGVGVLWARRTLLDRLPPYQTGSNMAHNVDASSAELEHGAQKFQAGTLNVSGPVGLAAAVRYLDTLGAQAIAAHDQALVRHGLARLRETKGLRLLGPADERHRVPVFSFTLTGRTVPELVAALDREGIAIRGGDLAARPLLRRLAGIDAAARASAYLYNSTNDLDRLADVLKSLTR